MLPANVRDLAKLIDHTLLKADATEAQIIKLCEEAKTHSFYSVCLNPRWLPLASSMLKGASTIPITVVGFPLGASLSATKEKETAQSVRAGAREIDMVLDVGALKSGHLSEVEADVAGVVKAAGGIPVKVILEICYLSSQELFDACKMCCEAGAAFVKTSTGFGPGGATEEAVKVMRKTVGPAIGVKASGGIRDWATAKKMILAGANRVGASASVSILEEAKRELGT